MPADSLFALPAGGSNPPTAGLMLSECTPLQPGDWVVQNAANSGVGRSLIALAKLRGLKTINLARDDATFAELTAAGADVVHVDDPDAVGDVRAVIGDARVALAVEAVGGPVVARLLELLSDEGFQQRRLGMIHSRPITQKMAHSPPWTPHPSVVGLAHADQRPHLVINANPLAHQGREERYLVRSSACWASGGIAAATNPPVTARKATNTSVVAIHRRSPRLTNHEAAGSSPTARKNATPMSTTIDDTAMRTRTIPYITATPTAAVDPI